MKRLLDVVAVLAQMTLGDREVPAEEKKEMLDQIQVRLSVLKERKMYFDNDLVLWAGPQTLADEEAMFENIVANRIAQLKCQPINSSASPVTSPLTSSTI